MNATWLNLNLQNSNSPMMEQLIFFHDHTMLVLIMITILMVYIMITLMISPMTNSGFLSNHYLEIIWIILPTIILLFIAIPSLRLLYLTNEMNSPLLTIKITGRQWLWNYSYHSHSNYSYDSSSIMTTDSRTHMLNVDLPLMLPYNTPSRLLITSSDVLHSWTVPALGLKVDATPGRLSQLSLLANRPGMFWGQCSEICGINHSFMPISLEITSPKYIISTLAQMSESDK